MELYELSGAAAAAAIRSGETTSEELVQACLERIAALEGEIGAWEYLEPALALRQAREADRLRRSGRPTGPLHGVPVGIKDIFDTGDMPTTDGTVLHAGRTPGEDATAVARLREAGAVIMGKTVTAELAFLHPGRTRNPHDPTRTPGGSSSGSAAAVAAAMVPLAIGTQTNGSVIRPAAYCGVCGYKPTRGLISRHRVLRLSRTLDQVGVFGRTPEDLALIAEAMSGCDEQDPDMRPRARPALVEGVAEAPPVPPRLAFVKTPAWNQADQDLQAAFAELTGFLGDRVEELDLDGLLTGVYDQHRAIMEAEMAWNLRRDYARGAEAMSRELRGQIEAGQQRPALEYLAALEQIPSLNRALEELLMEYDAILTPATTGEAPVGLGSTGSPVFCTPWTLAGMPAVSLPLLQGGNGLPVGVQLTAARHDDARLLRTANWLVGQVEQARGQF